MVRIYDARGTIAAENDDWWSEGDAGLIQNLSADLGAFRINPGREAAILVTLAPGAYTAVLADASRGVEGVGLLEIYSVSSGLLQAQSVTAR